MSDKFPPEKRSQIMANVKGRNTSPERVVRGCLRRLRCRFRGNVKALPGKPDVVLTGRGKVIFVHGCFWHGHRRCRRSKRPTTNEMFWNKKIDGNIQRDKKVRRALTRLGWKVLVVWECGTRNPTKLLAILERFVNAR
ncbi:MAG TPA: very short patch repair endonuclease [bacterium]|nr:very short patch repair endonuclease [bacterium]HNS48137.1 very short patch repair endonuclease [bacterium]